jgi:hypothetical protein
MSAKIAIINLDNQDESFKSLLEYNYLNLKSEGKDNIFIERNYAMELLNNFVRLQVAKGNLIPKEGYIVDSLEEKQMNEAQNFVKNNFGF